jgi:hypothetical protein
VQRRLWAGINALDGLEFVHKGGVFEKRYDGLSCWIRRHFKRVKGVDGYLGNGALNWYQNGGRLQHHQDWG